MIDRFTKRLEAQKGNRAYIQPKIYLIEEDEEKQVIDSNEPLSPSELKFYLEKMENEENKNTQIVPNSIAFDSINSFCAWYEPRRDKFLEKQRPAFESLVHANTNDTAFNVMVIILQVQFYRYKLKSTRSDFIQDDSAFTVTLSWPSAPLSLPSASSSSSSSESRSAIKASTSVFEVVVASAFFSDLPSSDDKLPTRRMSTALSPTK